MTREEAIKAFEEIKVNAQNNLGAKWAHGCDGYYRDKIELTDAALKALRPVSREQVERVWRGEWKRYLPPLGAGDVQCRCTRCGRTPDVETPFCAWCGAPMTDEAVQTVMERLEMLKDGKDICS